MARNDEWCDLCDDKLKEVGVYYGRTKREIAICGHCFSICPECEEIKEEGL